MSEDEGQFSELAIFLAQTWQSSSTDRIDLDTISRIWAFDLGWFNMETANRVRDNLIKTEWLDVTSEGVKPNVMIENVDVPFGWLPTMRILETPPQAPRQTRLPPNEGRLKLSSKNKKKSKLRPQTQPQHTLPNYWIKFLMRQDCNERKSCGELSVSEGH
ncbi:MAG: hypothetical protein Ct9H90mP16_17940 [Candidatus Poseidoniales archaeon]|nr:MAG: hypothetical protein Ct9H90mP16_17940 [Candidatus Poseidoniales archaeon]